MIPASIDAVVIANGSGVDRVVRCISQAFQGASIPQDQCSRADEGATGEPKTEATDYSGDILRLLLLGLWLGHVVIFLRTLPKNKPRHGLTP